MTEYRVGDKIRVTDTVEGVVGGFTKYGVSIDGKFYSLSATDWTRTIEVIERAPVPWQAGDVARHPVTGNPVIRQADETWINTMGQTTALTDEDIRAFKPIVRGGKRVAG